MKHICILFVSVFFYCGVLAVEPYQPQVQASIGEKWRWTELEAVDGVGFEHAVEAPNGDIWFGGKGMLARYDGAKFERYPLEGSNWNRGLFANSRGRLFAMTDIGCLVLESDEWVSFLPPSTPLGWVRDMCEAKDGSLWFAGSSYVARYDGRTTEYFKTDVTTPNSIVVDGRNKLWISDGEGHTIWVYDASVLTREDLSLSYRFDLSETGMGSRLFLDYEDRVWMFSHDGSGSCQFFENYELQEDRLWLGDAFERAFDFDMVELGNGSYAFLVPRGLTVKLGEEVQRYSGAEYPIPTSDTFIVALSDRRILVGGSDSTVYLIDASTERWSSYLNLNYQCDDSFGANWFLDHDGLVVSSGIDGESWWSYSENDGIVDTPNRVHCSRDGTLWVSGSHENVAALSYRTGRDWVRIVYPNAGLVFSHLGVLETEAGAMVFGSGSPRLDMEGRSGGAVVFEKNGNTWSGGLISPPAYPKRPAIMVERAGDGTWFGGDWLSVCREAGNLERVDLLDRKHWTDHLLVDSAGDLWAAKWGVGVFRYDGEVWVCFTEANGLASDQVIYLLDGKENPGIWAATSRGLSRYDGNVWSSWSVPLDIPFRRESHSLFEGSRGELWINYAYRQWLLDGESVSRRAPLYRTLRYKGNGMAPETEILESKSDLLEGSAVSIVWTGQDQWSETPKGELEFSWRMNETGWSPFSLDTSVLLYDVRPGSHLFQVRARDRDWNIDMVPAQVEVRIIPALWKRSWFIAVILATIALIVFLLYRLLKLRVQSAIAMEEFKLDFFTNISHELKNPLAVIVGPLESLLRDGWSGQAPRRIEMALRNARKMQGLISELLQFRKLEQGKADCRPASGEIVSFIRETIDLLAPLWQEKEQHVQVRCNVKSCVCGYDADKLQKIVDNLLSNAIKYSEQGGEIEIGFEIDGSTRGKTLRLEVEDHGQGIPTNEIEHVLKPFYRVKAVRQTSEGVGLGLALVAELVKVCGGEISIESPVDLVEGRGTRVVVSLPLSVIEKAISDVAGLYEVGEGLEAIVDNPVENVVRLPKVLIVEDNEDLRNFMRDELSDCYEVLEACDGEAGVELARRQEPDLIVSDVMMPGMDGFQLCRQLKTSEETSHIPIIILTAKNSEEHQIEGVNVGADAYFSKPLNMARLMAQIENLLEARRKLRQRFSKELVIEPTDLAIESADQVFLSKAISVVEQRMREFEFDVVQFAKEMAMGRTTFYKKLKALTGMSPNVFIRSMRMKRAAQLLKSGELSVSETLQYVGFLDHSHFSRTFKKQFGVSPSQFAEKNTNSG